MALRLMILAVLGILAALGTLLAAPAYAQAPSSSSSIGIPYNAETPLSAEELARRKEVDRDYNAAMQKIPEKKTADPWGDVRAASPSRKAKNNNNN
jgi:hypothetical protein